MTEHDDRIILHFDLDAFYVACERELNPALRGVPVGVSQYNPFGSLQERSASEIDARLVQSPSNTNDGGAHEDANGSLIAVSYEARAAGVRRNDRGLEATKKCPALNIVVVPVKHGKADLTLYRSASKRVINSLTNAIQHMIPSASGSKTVDVPVEVASIDEVYVDVTKLVDKIMDEAKADDTVWNSCIQEARACTTIGGIETLSDAAQATNALDKVDLRKGSKLQVLDSYLETIDAGSLAWWNRSRSEWDEAEIRLAMGAMVAARARRTVSGAFEGGVYTLSAGVSNNKTLAKLASGLKKPNRQTLINASDPTPLEKLFHPLPLSRIRGLGGQFGVKVSQDFQVKTVGELSQIPLSTLQSKLEAKAALFLYEISRGTCRDLVTPRTRPKSIASSKTFRGVNSISSTDKDTLKKWIGELCNELKERLEADNEEYRRTASTLVVSVGVSEEGPSSSKQCRTPRSLSGYSDVALKLAIQLIEASKSRIRADSVTITCISVSATQFVDQAAGSSTIMAAFERSERNDVSSVSPVRARSPLQTRKRKPSAMDKWLASSISDRKSDDKRSIDEGGVARQQRPAKRSTGPPRIEHSTITTACKAVSLPTMDEIGPQVLGELPDDVRKSIMKDIGRAHPSANAKKEGGIQTFFQRKR